MSPVSLLRRPRFIAGKLACLLVSLPAAAQQQAPPAESEKPPSNEAPPEDNGSSSESPSTPEKPGTEPGSEAGDTPTESEDAPRQEDGAPSGEPESGKPKSGETKPDETKSNDAAAPDDAPQKDAAPAGEPSPATAPSDAEQPAPAAAGAPTETTPAPVPAREAPATGSPPATNSATLVSPEASAAPGNDPGALDDLAGGDSTEFDVESVVVIGRPLGLTEPAGSYDVTTRRGLQDEHPDDTYELFNKTPGVALSRYGQGIINTDVAIRGFAGDGVTPHAKLMIDGMPAHLHNGYGELDQMFSLGIGSISVFKGTSDVRYGRFNTAGNYNVRSRSDITTDVQGTIGTFESLEAQAYSGLDLGPATQHLFVGYRQSEGYRDHSDLQKFTASGRWIVNLNDAGSLTFSGRVAGYDADSPGFLTEDEAEDDPTSSADFANQDGGDKNSQHLSLHLEHGFFDDQLQLNAWLYRQAFERTRWVRFSEEGALQERYDDQTQVGGIATLGWTPHRDWLVSLGVDIQHEDVIEQRFGTIGQSRTRDTANTIRNFEYDLQSFGGYVSVEHTLYERLRWSVGLRADGFDGDFRSTDAEGESASADIVDYDVFLQPKVNLTGMITKGVFAFANYGRTFQSPFGSSFYAVEDADRSTELSVNDGWEAGAKVDLDLGLQARLSYWQQLASNEFVSVDGENENVGETSRSGVEAVLAWSILNSVVLWGNFSWTLTDITNPGEDAEATTGNRLRSVPDFTTSFGARYDITPNFFVAAHVDGQGSYYVNENNEGGKFGDYLLAHVKGGFQNEKNRIQLQVNNVFDSDHEYVFDFSDDGSFTIHAPGDGIEANVSYTRSF